jgi:hypothetical protein
VKRGRYGGIGRAKPAQYPHFSFCPTQAIRMIINCSIIKYRFRERRGNRMIQNNPMPKQRHGCLTAWLIVAIIANSAVGLFYFFNLAASGSMPHLSAWALPLLILLSFFNVLCAILLFRWKKLGFWGFCLSSTLAIIINLALGLGIFQSAVGLIGIAVLYGVLQIGKENKGWPQLE